MFPSHLPTPRRPAAQSIPILRWGIIGPRLDRRALCALIENLQPAAGGGGGFPQPGRRPTGWPRNGGSPEAYGRGGGDAGASGY